MAFGGFKYATVEVHGVPGGGTYTDQGTAVADIARAIIGTGEGWSLDTDLSQDFDDYDIFNHLGAALFLVHTNGAKLCLAMTITADKNLVINAGLMFNYSTKSPTVASGSVGGGGLVIGYIPPGMGSFDRSSATSSGLMPSRGLRFVGIGKTSTASSNKKGFIEMDVSSSVVYKYSFFVRGDTLVFHATTKSARNTVGGLIIVGNIYTCAQSGDTLPYGSVMFSSNTTTAGEYTTTATQWPLNVSASSTNLTFGGSTQANAQMFSKDGGLIAGKTPLYRTSVAGGTARVISPSTDTCASTSANSRRFVPFQAYSDISSETGKGIVPFDGYKGIVNPEVACRIWQPASGDGVLPPGTLLDGGKMIHVFSGICVGFDESNATTPWND